MMKLTKPYLPILKYYLKLYFSNRKLCASAASGYKDDSHYTYSRCSDCTAKNKFMLTTIANYWKHWKSQAGMSTLLIIFNVNQICYLICLTFDADCKQEPD